MVRKTFRMIGSPFKPFLDDMLFRLQKLYAIKRPTKKNQNSIYQATTQNLVDMESYWPCQTGDLAALAPDAEHGWFNGFLEDILNKIPKRVLKVRACPSLLISLRSVVVGRSPSRSS